MAKYFTVGYYDGMSDTCTNIQIDFLEFFLCIKCRFQVQSLQEKKKGITFKLLIKWFFTVCGNQFPTFGSKCHISED